MVFNWDVLEGVGLEHDIIQYWISPWLVWVSYPSCVPSQLLVKINSIPAEPRTLSTPYSIPSTSCLDPTLSNYLPSLFLSLRERYIHIHIYHSLSLWAIPLTCLLNSFNPWLWGSICLNSLSGQEKWCVVLDCCMLHLELVAGVFGAARAHGLWVEDVYLQ